MFPQSKCFLFQLWYYVLYSPFNLFHLVVLSYWPAMDMCLTGKAQRVKHKSSVEFFRSIFHGWLSYSLSLKTQGNDKALFFLIASEPLGLITVTLKWQTTKREQVHSNHNKNKQKTSQFHLEVHLSNSDCSHYRNSHSETVPSPLQNRSSDCLYSLSTIVGP